MFYVFQSEILH